MVLHEADRRRTHENQQRASFSSFENFFDAFLVIFRTIKRKRRPVNRTGRFCFQFFLEAAARRAPASCLRSCALLSEHFFQKTLSAFFDQLIQHLAGIFFRLICQARVFSRHIFTGHVVADKCAEEHLTVVNRGVGAKGTWQEPPSALETALSA